MMNNIRRHLKGVALFAGASFLLVGCQPAPVDVEPVVDAQSVAVQTTDMAYAVAGGIEIERVDEGRIGFIPQEEGTVVELAWNDDGSRLGWITRVGSTGAKDTYYTINWANTSDLAVETAYLSRIEPYAITFAPIGGYIGFIEDESLYSVQIENGEVFKVYEQIDRDQYAWSPEFAAVVVRGEESTQYIEIEEGRPVSSIELFETPLDGLAFIDANTVLGVEQEQQTARLQSIDLRTSTAEQVHEWEYAYDFLNDTEGESQEVVEESTDAETDDVESAEESNDESGDEDQTANEEETAAGESANQEESADEEELAEEDDAAAEDLAEEEPEITDEMRMHRFHTFVGPTGDFVIEEHQLVGGDSSAYLYNTKKDRAQILTDAAVIGWASKQSIIVESLEDDSIRRVTVDTKQSIDLYESVDTYTVLAGLKDE